MTENLALFTGTTYTDFEVATAEQIAMANGRKEPNLKDFEWAVEKARHWNNQRQALSLSNW